MHTLKLTGAIGLLSAVLASACAGPSSSLPTSPSAVSSFGGGQTSATASSDSSAAEIGLGDESATFGKPAGTPGNGNGGNGNGNSGGGNGNGNGKPPTAQAPAAPTPKKVELEGLISALAGTVLTVNGQDVTVPATVVPHHGWKPIPFADLKVGDRVHIKAEDVSGVLTATDVKLQNPGDEEEESEELVDINGLVTGLSDVALCPVASFTMGSTLVKVDANTVFVGGTCSTLINGGSVTVTGSFQLDTSFLATKVQM